MTDESDYLSLLAAKHRMNGLLLDTAPLIILVIGLANPNSVGVHKRTRGYTINDFIFIRNLTSQFQRLLTTPNIFTEADNLCRQTDSAESSKIGAILETLASSLEETYLPSREVVKHKSFARLGLSDTTSLALPSPYLLLTADFALWSSAASLKIDAVNINHLRVTDD